jgi:cytochrome c peroxidase
VERLALNIAPAHRFGQLRPWRVAAGILIGLQVAIAAAAAPPYPSAKAMEALGRRLFFDRNLSASHRQSCASCHDPAFAYGPPDTRPVQLGGPQLRTQGLRAAPSLRYLQKLPFFTEHYFDEDFDESVDNGPTGGFTWDGRARTSHEQARIPLLSPQEMANGNPDAVVAAIARSDYAGEFRRVFGNDIFEKPAKAFDAATRALEVFEQNPDEFYPYSSKYDAYLRQQTTLSGREMHGLALFNNPGKGNCAHCHPSARGVNGSFPAFTDFGYAAIGAPRNRGLAVNRDLHYYDLGLCGPLRQDLTGHPEYCGLFRTPSLRNVALRRRFFHNGVFGSLREVLGFYAERDIHPEKFYAHDTRGHVIAYDDLPPQYRNNIDREPPFDRKAGDKPALTSEEIDDIIAFLRTLTDGWTPSVAAAAN